MSVTEEQDLKKKFNWKRIMIPVVLGLAAAIYILVHHLNTYNFVLANEGESGTHNWVDSNANGQVDRSDEAEFVPAMHGAYIMKSSRQILGDFEWDKAAFLALLGALVMVVIRDLGYIYRIRILTGGKLSWKASFEVIMLWEFASAMTPSVVGGSGVAMFIIHREGINLGKATAITFVTAMLDEIFYIVMVPIVFILIGSASLFPEVQISESFGTSSIKVLFYIGYFFIVFLTSIILIGVVWKPHWFKRTLQRITSIKPLKRFRKKATKMGDEIIISSKELKGQPLMYWIKAFSATMISWTARFFTLNFIIMAFVKDWNFSQLLVYGRQLVMWVIMLISPTPGGSGIAEIALSKFFDYLVPAGLLAVIAIVWRMLTYFPYLFMGAFILPRWFARTALIKQSEGNTEPEPQ
ncbi:MAG: lysylphosphatidylglycerol synthase transmembrane domain-containing protein [Flavobacteriales bacterium]|nr:lysylphosphatidylglycerol synthase transmembrane domain-containing protein [Flavobacteriales bacterium]